MTWQARSSHAVVASIQADLADHRSISAAVDRIAGTTDGVDLLVNNAGVLLRGKHMSPQGNEMHFEVNAVAPYQLVRRLSRLLAARRGTIVSAASLGAYRCGHLRIDELRDPSDTRRLFGPYSQSKLALAVISIALAPDLQAQQVMVRAADPGPTKTPQTYGPGMPPIMKPLRTLFFGPARRGAQRMVQAATDPRFGSRAGVYIAKGRIQPPPRDAADAGIQERLVDLCRTLTTV